MWMRKCLQRWLGNAAAKLERICINSPLFFYIQENNMSSETCICKFSASQARSSALECG